MLEIDVVTKESFDEEARKFITTDSFKVNLEHSLATASKWESVWEKAFLGKQEKTPEEIISYVRIMIVNEELPPEVFQKLINEYLEVIKDYIAAPMSATKLYVDPNAPTSRENVTTELIYYWMISLNIPVEFQHWHLNRLIMLIRVINLKNTPKKKMTLSQRRDLNRSRLVQFNTKG